MSWSQKTQYEKIIYIMMMNRNKKWWSAADFQKEWSGEFVGYEATARLSELEKKCPKMFSGMRDGRFCLRRIRFEEPNEWWSDLDPDIKHYMQLCNEKINRNKNV